MPLAKGQVPLTKEQKRARRIEWEKRNPEKLKEYRRRMIAKDPEAHRAKGRETMKKWRMEHLEQYRETHKMAERKRRADDPIGILAGELRRRYGLTLEQYQAMSAAQGDRCAICGGEPRGLYRGNKRTPPRLAVDHCHLGEECHGPELRSANRGLLCGPCNTVLGLLEDDPDRARRAADYIEAHSTKAKATP